MKSLIHFHYGTTIPRDGVPIAALKTPQIHATASVDLVDYSQRVAENSFFEKAIEFTITTGPLVQDVSKREILLTDRFQGDRPLPFGHRLQAIVYQDALGSSSATVLDGSGNAVPQERYLYDITTRTIYHDLDDDELYFATFARADSVNAVVESNYQELLSIVPAFVEATDAHILANGTLNPDADAYLIEEQTGRSYPWRITLPRPATYALEILEHGLLRVHPPTADPGEPWYVEVDHTVLHTHNRMTNRALRYDVAEFELQDFRPYPPIRLEVDEMAVVLNRRAISLAHGNIVRSNRTPIDIKIFAPDGILVQALTDDATKQGKLFRSIPWQVISFNSIDVGRGRIILRQALSAGARVLVSYYRTATRYQYTGYNFNPLYNPLATSTRVGILCRPDFRKATFSTTLSHITINGDGEVVTASDPEISDWLDGSVSSWESFVAAWLFDPTQSTDNHRDYLLLGILRSGLGAAIEQVAITDVRRNGGGIANNVIAEALLDCPESIQNWNLKSWDGPAEPIQGAMVLFLPSYLLDFYTRDEIRTRALRYAPAGSYPILRFYE